MSFPNRLSQLRHEKGFSQKEAAVALGISQALLSHYENGIREPGLDFLRKAAGFYGVTSDWLLGISNTRLGEHEIFDAADCPSDTEMRIRTLFRCMVRMSEEIDLYGKDSIPDYEKYIGLCLYRYYIANRKSTSAPAAIQNTELFTEMLLRKCLSESSVSVFQEPQSELPLCIQTMIRYSENAIKEIISGIN